MEEANHSDQTAIFELEDIKDKENVAPSSDPTYKPSDDDGSDISESSNSSEDFDNEPTAAQMWEDFEREHPWEAKYLENMPWMSLDSLELICEFAQEMSCLGWNVFGWKDNVREKK